MQNKVERVFRRLKAEGKIKIAKDIAMKKWVPNFKAGIFKRMKYNARMNGLSEEDIEFCLLHEEGHFKCPVKKKRMVLFGNLISVILSVYKLFPILWCYRHVSFSFIYSCLGF